jgi:DNA invertase Pin-like site-specific DNA recombinase
VVRRDIHNRRFMSDKTSRFHITSASMITAIYARKSTEQNGVADEQRSVGRQVEHARAYASRKGWIVADEHVYVDDGVSGAEFANRPGFLRLMNAFKPRPAFQVLVMSEESRLGREQIEVSYSLKQIVSAGVRGFSISRTGNGRSTRRATRSCCRSRPSRMNSNARRPATDVRLPRSP